MSLTSVKSIALLSVSLLSVAIGPANAAPCRPLHNVARVLTPNDAAIAHDGGVLVMATPETPGDNQVIADGSGDAAQQPTWKLVQRKRNIRTMMTVLAPGLVRYDVVGNNIGAQRLVGPLGKVLISYVRNSAAAKADRVAAPDVSSVESASYGDDRRRTITYTANFGTAAPSGTVAAVIYGQDPATSAEQAWRWTVVPQGATTFVIERQGRSCGAPTVGTVALSASSIVSVAWVDASGRLSPRSKPIKITAAATNHQHP